MNNILQPTSPIGAIQSVCTELGLSHTTYMINCVGIDVSATIMTGTDDTIVFSHPDWIYIVRKDHYLQLHDGPEGQTLYFGPILRGTMGLDLSWCDNHISEIRDLMRALKLAQKDWYCVVWGHNHVPTTKIHQKWIETAIGHSIDADIGFDDQGYVSASVILELNEIEVEKLRAFEWIWHVEPVAEPIPSMYVFALTDAIDGIEEDYRVWALEDWTHAVPFEDSWDESDWLSIKSYYGFSHYSVDRTGACENGACILFK